VSEWLESGCARGGAQRLLSRTLPYLSTEARQYWMQNAYMLEPASTEGGGMNGLYLVRSAYVYDCLWVNLRAVVRTSIASIMDTHCAHRPH
jgi:hypothetical protein